MKKTTLWLVALLAIATFAGCNKTNTPVNNPDENVGMANPASVYCEEKWGTLIPMEDEAWNQYAMCQIDEETVCEEWAYYRWECPAGENSDITAEPTYEIDYGTSEIYSEEDLKSAANAIMNIFNNEWDIKCDMKKLNYLWDELSTANLNYCKNFYADVEDCVVFTSDFYIPNTDQEMAWAFEPDKNIEWWSWYLWRIAGEDWIVLTNGL